MDEPNYSHFKYDGTNYYAGDHIFIDMYDPYNITDIKFVEECMKDAILVAGATILSSHFHYFTENCGVTGVIVLSESHFSCHTWNEKSLAVFDIFMCGDANPSLAIPVLEKWFTPSKMIITHHKRGIV